MVLTIRQTRLLINQFNNIIINQQVQITASINYVISPFERNINPEDPTGLTIYLQAKK